MASKVNIDSKNNLARLLATENIWIQHRNVDTASFDLVSRILTFPIWKDMSDAIYNMLAGHEVGHALYDEHTDGIEIGKRIDPKNPLIAFRYWNIVADVRIERLIKTEYPGLIRSFRTAYQELYDRNMFGTNGKDVNQLSFIDRINLHFKIGQHLNLVFTPEEMQYVTMVESTMTSEDVVDVSKIIYEYSKPSPPPESPKSSPQQSQKQPPQPGKGEPGEDGEGDGEGEDESDDSQDSKKSKKGKKQRKKSKETGDEDADNQDELQETEGTPGDGESDSEDGDAGDAEGADGDASPDDSDSTGDDCGDGSDGDNDGDTGETSGDESDASDNSEPGNPKDGSVGTGPDAVEPVDPGPPPCPTTQDAFDKRLQDFVDHNAAPVEYVTLPKPNLKNILVDYTTVHKDIRLHSFVDEKYNSKKFKTNAQHWEASEQAFEEFRKKNSSRVNYIFQQFEMKKQAERYLRTKTHKTGSIDPLRMWAYKTEEDLFKTVAVIADAKNHGLLFVVDWSGSMSSSMIGTIEQLIVLCMFCRKANIPFEVYSLTTGASKAFDVKPGDLCFTSNFRMRCYLSSAMTAKQFQAACVNLFALTITGHFTGGPSADHLIGCTPLDEAIVTTIDLMGDFRQRTRAQVVNAVFLTDGDANTVSAYLNKKGKKQELNSATRYLIDDRQTHKVYDFDTSTMTPTLLQILRDRQDINVVGFYIGGHWSKFFYGADDKTRTELARQFEENNYVIATDWGYNELYITNRGDSLRVHEHSLKPDTKKFPLGSPEYEVELNKNFSAHRHMLKKERLMLDRFVQMIS